MAWFPVFLELHGRHCVVVGGGPIAEAKAVGFLAAGAAVTVVSPALTPGLARLVRTGDLVHVARRWRAVDLAASALACVAVGDPRLGAAVRAAAGRRGVWVNAADDPAHCDYILPAVVRRGPVTVAIGTGGTSPALARRVREHLEQTLGPEWGALARLAGAVRRELRAAGARPAPAAWRSALDADVLKLAGGGRVNAARRLMLRRLRPRGAGQRARRTRRALSARSGNVAPRPRIAPGRAAGTARGQVVAARV